MAKFVCIKECFWGRRHWDPNSPREKDFLYEGDETPPKKLFRALGDGKAPAPKVSSKPKPVAMSALLPKSSVQDGVDADAAIEAMAPVVDDVLS